MKKSRLEHSQVWVGTIP